MRDIARKMSEETTPTTHPPAGPPLSDEAVGAVSALVRVAELYDPAVAHRAALRAAIAGRLAAKLDTPIDRSIFIAAAALGDVDLAITRPDNPEADNDTTRVLLGATVLNRLSGLGDVSVAVGARGEWWNGNGFPGGLSGTDIPLAARVLSVADALVGNPAPGFLPTWEHARRRVGSLSGTALDPDIAQLAMNISLEDIELPLIPSSEIAKLLSHARAVDSSSGTQDAATAIKAAVDAAGDTNDVLALFARSALEVLRAEDVMILTSNETEFSRKPLLRESRSGRSRVEPRLDQILEFSTQVELRAGVSVELSTAQASHIDTIVCPIMVSNRCWGAIAALRSESDLQFDETDISALRHVASEMSSAIDRSTHWAEMERMALRDQLTGLSNRHDLYRVLDGVFDRPVTERLDTALIMCDVDGLKTVNDTLGHQAGDRLLMDAADALRASVRDPERTTVCRMGGDEFCVVIDGGALLTAHEVSDTIERLFARSGGSDETRSISCGIAFADATVTSRSALLRAADENQYTIKKSRKLARQQDGIDLTINQSRGYDRRAIRD